VKENQKKHISTATIAMGSIIFSAAIASILSTDSSPLLTTIGLILSVILYCIGIIILKEKSYD
jgi:hypothetical protein